MRLKQLWRYWPAAWLPVIAACAAGAPVSGTDHPAVLSAPNEAARQELQQVVARMLGVPSVRLAEDVLLRESLLVIEKARPRDARGIPLSGRDFDRPEQFRLFVVAGNCVLLRVRTGERQVLQRARCAESAT